MSAQSDKSRSSSLPSSPLGWSGSGSEGSFAGTAIGPTRANEDRIKSSREGEKGESPQNEGAHAVADQSTLGGVEETRPSATLL